MGLSRAGARAETIDLRSRLALVAKAVAKLSLRALSCAFPQAPATLPVQVNKLLLRSVSPAHNR